MARIGRTAAVLGGCAVMAYGAWGLFLSHQVGHSANLLVWLAASVLAHDAVLAPVVFALCWAGTRLLPGPARSWAAGALLVGGTAVLVGLPALVWAGRDVNPTVLPLDYGRNILLVLLLVIGVAIAGAGGTAAVGAARRTIRPGRAASPEDHQEPKPAHPEEQEHGEHREHPERQNQEDDEHDEHDEHDTTKRSQAIQSKATTHMTGNPRLATMNEAADVLVVDDDQTVAEIVSTYLRRAGHHVRHAADGYEAVAAAEARLPDLVVLDLMLPGIDGIEVHQRIRELGPVPVIMLTARSEESDRILGLETGADDYVTKPFSPRELVLRAESVLSRARSGPGMARPAAAVYRSGDLSLDIAGRHAERAGAPLDLTVREFDLLAFFMAHPGRAFGRDELMRRVWDWEYGDMSTVTVHVRRLREKIEDDPARPSRIATVWGVGYRFDAETVPDE